MVASSAQAARDMNPVRRGVRLGRFAWAALGVLLAGALLQSNRIRGLALLFPGAVGFVEAAPDVWVDPALEPQRRGALVGAVSDALTIRARFYPAPEARPVFVACATSRCFRRLGGIARATAFVGGRVLIGPEGSGPAKIAHELSHLELAARVGAVRALLRVPTWFDEGLAALASDDPDYDEAQWAAATDGGRAAPTLDELATMGGFLRSMRGDPRRAYATARREVARWHALAGPAGLEALYRALRAGEPFAEAYAAAERGAPRGG